MKVVVISLLLSFSTVVFADCGVQDGHAIFKKLDYSSCSDQELEFAKKFILDRVDVYEKEPAATLGGGNNLASVQQRITLSLAKSSLALIHQELNSRK